MLWREMPIPDHFLGERKNSLDLRNEFQDFCSMAEKFGYLGRPLRPAFDNLVQRHRLYEIIKVEERPGALRLILAHMWRLTRLEGHPGLLLHTFDLAQGRWREQAPEAITWHKWEQGLPNSAESIWPDLRETGYQREKAGPGLFKNIMAAWLAKVRPALRVEVKPSLDPGEEEWLAHLLFFRWSVSLPAERRSGLIGSALNCYIWEPLASLFPMSRDIQPSPSEVLAAQLADLARIKRESPKAWPLLFFIPSAWWPRRDLWQDKVLRAASPVFENLSPAGLRWLRRAPAETLVYFRQCFVEVKNEWSVEEQPGVAKEVAELMASLPPQATEQPELAKAVMASCLELLDCFKEMDPFLEEWTPARQVLQDRLLRLQARHIVALWEPGENPREKLKVIRQEVWDERKYILDWFNAEGHRLGLPDKNSTWRSLKRRSDKWHEGFRRAAPLEDWTALMGSENAAWESLLGETVIDGLKVTPLITGRDLYSESLEMRHCVVAYAPLCLNGGWRVFSLQEADGARSTLSLKPGSNGFAIDQHKGQENRPVSPAAARAAGEVCRLYNRKGREAAETAMTGAAAGRLSGKPVAAEAPSAPG